MSFDITQIREQFPTLSEQVKGHQLVYLDNGATTLKTVGVIEAVNTYNQKETSNVHRGIHTLSERSTVKYERTRDLVQELIGANKREEIIFTKGTTESINLLAYTLGNSISAGDEIIISQMEHHSNIVPWQMLCERKEAKLKVIPMNEKGELIISHFEELISDRTKIVSVNWISNSLGTINPIQDIIKIARTVGAKVIIDGAQAASHLHIDVKQLDIDFLVFSAHKMFGPTGVGVLYGKEELLNAMPPFHGGGDMIDKVTFKKTTYNDLPYKFEAGTPNISGVIGFGAAIEFINQLDFNEVKAHEDELLNYAREQLTKIKGLKEIGTAANKANIFSFVIDGIHPQDIATLIDNYGIAIRTGHHCTQPVMEHFKVSATCRASFSIYNTKEEVDKLYESLLKVIDLFL
jgi:cysteine desulfurase / selenocysteine lyase